MGNCLPVEQLLRLLDGLHPQAPLSTRPSRPGAPQPSHQVLPLGFVGEEMPTQRRLQRACLLRFGFSV